MITEDNSEQANLVKLLAFRQQHTDHILSRYQIRPNLTIEELAQVVLYLSDRLTEEQQQRRSLESQLQELTALLRLVSHRKVFNSGFLTRRIAWLTQTATAVSI
jgi:ABC-type lipoprotein export system ATPase subunit